MKNAQTIFDEIQMHGQKIADDSTRIIAPEIGQYIPQGDVNFLVLPDLPPGVEQVEPSPQLAPGTSRGSRHCIAYQDMQHVEFYRLPNPNPLQGPILKLTQQITIEHPEHGNQVWPAETIIAVTYQRRYAEEIRRIQD